MHFLDSVIYLLIKALLLFNVILWNVIKLLSISQMNQYRMKSKF